MINHETFQIIKQLNRRVVAIPPVHIDMTGSLAGGYLLSQVFYWAEKKDFGEFYKTDVEFCEELHINIRQLKGAKKLLTDSGIVKIVRKGIPAKSYYQLDIEEYARQITSYDKTSQLVDTKRHNLMVQNVITNTETTTEITTDTSFKNYNKKNTKDLESDFERFWDVYPRQINKVVAKKAFMKAAKDFDVEEIIDGARLYASHTLNHNVANTFQPHPSTWLNGCQWENDLSTTKQIGNYNGQQKAAFNIFESGSILENAFSKG